MRPPLPLRKRGSYCQAAVRGHHPAHYVPARRGDGWSCAAPTRRACLPARPPCVVRVRAAVLCSRVRGHAAGVRSSGVRACTDATGRVPFLCVVLAHLGCGRVEQLREARGARRCWRRAALLAAGRPCDAAPPGLNRGTGLGPGAEGAEQRRNDGGRCACGSLGDRTQVAKWESSTGLGFGIGSPRGFVAYSGILRLLPNTCVLSCAGSGHKINWI